MGGGLRWLDHRLSWNQLRAKGVRFLITETLQGQFENCPFFVSREVFFIAVGGLPGRFVRLNLVGQANAQVAQVDHGCHEYDVDSHHQHNAPAGWLILAVS